MTKSKKLFTINISNLSPTSIKSGKIVQSRTIIIKKWTTVEADSKVRTPGPRVTLLVSRTPCSKCALCLDFYKTPVRITNCGHNFCHECLSEMLTAPNDDEHAWNCPTCRTEQSQGLQQLARNFFLERMLEQFIESRKNLCVAHKSTKKLRKY